MLADLIWYAQAHLEAKCIVTLATLTGAVLVALGKENAGLFANDDALAAQLTAAGLDTGETVWRLPLSKKYNKALDSKDRGYEEYRRPRCRLDHRGAVPATFREQRHALGASRHRGHGDGLSGDRH